MLLAQSYNANTRAEALFFRLICLTYFPFSDVNYPIILIGVGLLAKTVDSTLESWAA